MGGDGGSIPHRSEQVKVKTKKEVLSREVIEAARWKHCALSQNPLRLPIVSCKMGKLYNKESILEFLLDRNKFPNHADCHTKKLKDVKELKLKIDKPDFSTKTVVNQTSYLTFICPILGIEMNGLHKFVYLWNCGCVTSKRALDNVKDNHCLVCNKEFKSDDVILINPSNSEEIEAANKRIYLLTTKVKKRAVTNSLKDSDASKVKYAKITSSKEEQDAVNKDDEKYKKSSVYKSLFTTCDEAKNQEKAHWVTYNPLYFR